mmetsp:Transcript_37499/g.60040  ORF Transcript_37499/g.60040 Transcript_37499/m.60040 type:complete len:207 (-) Transcript_37499:371-991(-)
MTVHIEHRRTLQHLVLGVVLLFMVLVHHIVDHSESILFAIVIHVHQTQLIHRCHISLLPLLFLLCSSIWLQPQVQRITDNLESQRIHNLRHLLDGLHHFHRILALKFLQHLIGVDPEHTLIVCKVGIPEIVANALPRHFVLLFVCGVFPIRVLHIFLQVLANQFGARRDVFLILRGKLHQDPASVFHAPFELRVLFHAFFVVDISA